MTSIMHRSFADAMGFKWPKELAYIVNGEKVTWEQVRVERKKRQAERLRRIIDNRGPVRSAAFVWTFYVAVEIPYHGWHLYIRTLTDSWWIHSDNPLVLEIMWLYPCGLLPIIENFERWKEAFGKRYALPGRFKRQGVAAGWVECPWPGGWPRSFTPATEAAA